MKIFVGLPMHNASECVIETIKRAIVALDAVGADWTLTVVDDNSAWEHSRAVAVDIAHGKWGGKVQYRMACELFPGSPAPNLGKILNYCLDSVPADADWYLNIESDVYLQPDTLERLLEGIAATQVPAACPMQLTPTGEVDFIFWGAGIVTREQLSTVQALQPLMFPQRPKWCNLGCLLVKGAVARDPDCRCDDGMFNLFCVDQDYTSMVSKFYGRPLYCPDAKVIHVGRQSTREGQEGGHTAHEAVAKINQRWSAYLQGGLFASCSSM